MGNKAAGGAARGKRGRRDAPAYSGMAIEDFEAPKGFMSNIGVGGFGRVLAMVKRDEPGRRFAVKCLLKAKVLHRNQLDNCMNELRILTKMDHYAYVVNLFYAFQDETMLYMCTDLMLGGNLQRVLKQAPNGTLAGDPARIRQYAAELTLALQFLHSQNVVHRDIKPDNILLDAKGHLHLTDFNVSLYVEPGNEDLQKHEDGWGTRGYRAPEVYLRTGRGFIFACDWWSMGAVLYELFTGTVPYVKLNSDESSTDMLVRMNAENVDMSGIQPELAKDFVFKLLRFEPESRIGCQHGCNSEVMIMTHPYFEGMDWDALERYSDFNEIEHRSSTSNSEQASTKHTSNSDSEHTSRPADIKDFAVNFDETLDQKQKLKILQRNMGVFGFSGLDDLDDDEDDYAPLGPSQQELFKDWAFNVDFKLEQQQGPKFTLLQTVSSMSPEKIKNWIGTSPPETIKALCTEMKAYREQAMKENFDHVMAEIKIDKLMEENLKLTRRIGEIEAKLKNPSVAKPPQLAQGTQRTQGQEQKQEKDKVRDSTRDDNDAADDEEEVVLFSTESQNKDARKSNNDNLNNNSTSHMPISPTKSSNAPKATLEAAIIDADESETHIEASDKEAAEKSDEGKVEATKGQETLQKGKQVKTDESEIDFAKVMTLSLEDNSSSSESDDSEDSDKDESDGSHEKEESNEQEEPLDRSKGAKPETQENSIQFEAKGESTEVSK